MKKQNPEKIKSLFELIFEFPTCVQQMKNQQNFKNIIKVVNNQLNKIIRNNSQEIQRVCNGNNKLIFTAHLLREENNIKHYIIKMFSLMLSTQKMADFQNKLMVPVFIYRDMVRIWVKNKSNSNQQMEQSLKYMQQKLKISPKSFGRLEAHLIRNLLSEYSLKIYETMQQQTNSQQLITSNEMNRGKLQIVNQCFNLCIEIAIELVRKKLQLSAESGVLLVLYKKVLEGKLSFPKTITIARIITNYYILPETRLIVSTVIDLAKCFAIFTDVDRSVRMVYSNEQKNHKCMILIQIFLSNWPTILYFLQQRSTLSNFVLSLRHNCDTELHRAAIKILQYLVNYVTYYNPEKVLESGNIFDYFSTSVTYRILVLFYILLDNHNLFEIISSLIGPIQPLMKNISQLILKYLPKIFQKQQYHKSIIQYIQQNTIIVPRVGQQQQCDVFVHISSFCLDCILPYEFTHCQLRNCILDLKKNDKLIVNLPNELQQSLQLLLDTINTNTSLLESNTFNQGDSQALLASFYHLVVQTMKYIPWQRRYFHLIKLNTRILHYLTSIGYQPIDHVCFSCMQNIFKLNLNYFRYLEVTVLDDIGRFYYAHAEIYRLIETYRHDSLYAFPISRILLHIDYEKNDLYGEEPKKILEQCAMNGSETLIIQIIEIIKRKNLQSDEKGQIWGFRIICEQLIYHKSQEIVTLAVQFCQQMIDNHIDVKNIILQIKLESIQFSVLKKRLIYLFIRSEEGIRLIQEQLPYILEEYLQSWMKSGKNMTKQFATFIQNEHKRYKSMNNSAYLHKDQIYFDFGLEKQHHNLLVYLPWNICINKQEYYVAFAQYKRMKNKLKLKVLLHKQITDLLQISIYNIGSESYDKIVFNRAQSSELQTLITIHLQELLSIYGKTYKIRDYEPNQSIKKIIVRKQNVTLYVEYYKNHVYLQKININIYLSKIIYLPLGELNFINLLTTTSIGYNILKKNDVLKHYIKIIQQPTLQIDLLKGSIYCLGSIGYFASLNQKIQLLQIFLNRYDKEQNYQLKQMYIWMINILIKDEQIRKKVKDNKRWLLFQSKLCGWLSLPIFSLTNEIFPTDYNRFAYVKNSLPQRPYQEGFRQIFSFINDQFKEETNKKRQKEKIEDSLKLNQGNKNGRLLEITFKYIATINFSLEKINKINEIFSKYMNHHQFDRDFNSGFQLP